MWVSTRGRRRAPARRHAAPGRGPVALVTAVAVVAGGLTAVVTATITGGAQAAAARQVERLDRGVVSARSGSGNFVSWRLLGTDPSDVSFNVYRGTTRIASTPATGATNVLDAGAPAGAGYTVRAVIGGVEQPASGASLQFNDAGYLDVPISAPGADYSANDASVGDLDGDGDLDIVLKWEPGNAKDNSQSGVTGNVYVDGYRLDGTRLWRIDLGRNIRAGAHYTQFQVYDYDGDGDAEVAMKTADATVDGRGTVIGNGAADYRNVGGYILTGPEYLTMFDGRTGAAASTVAYVPGRGSVSSWGDGYGNRVDRFLAGTAYLDGSRPSLIMSRGYYTRAVVAAWDYRNGTLQQRWVFDSNTAGDGGYAGQGNHSLSVADVDADGKDEIVFGGATIDDNGRGLWTTGLGHGDAGHVGDLDPSRPGLEYFKVSETASRPSSWFADARTGQLLWQTAPGGDNGRGVSADIWAGSPGAESWSAVDTGLRNTKGVALGREPSSANFLIWWDADPVRELLDRNRIDKYGTGGETRLLTGAGVDSNNGTKATPSLSGDILGDWREEVIWRTADSRALRIYTTRAVTDVRIPTLLHDSQYRVALAWQNTAYNQPPHPSFFIGAGMSAAPWPAVYVPGGAPTPSSTTTTAPTTTAPTTTAPTTTAPTTTAPTTTAPTTTTPTTTTPTTTTPPRAVAGRASGRCLDVPRGVTSGATPVILYDCTGSSNQRFTSGPGSTLQVRGACLDAFQRGRVAGTRVVVWPCNGGANQQWQVNSNGTITSVLSGLCLDAYRAGTANGTIVQLWTCNGGANQQWSRALSSPSRPTR